MDKIIKKHGINEITNIVKISNSFVEVTKNLGYDPKEQNIKRYIERTIKRIGLSVGHFDSIRKVDRYDKEKLKKLVLKCGTFKDILLEIDILPVYSNYSTLKKYLKKYDIDFSHLVKKKSDNKNEIKQHKVKEYWEKDNLDKIIKTSKSQSEVLMNLGIRNAGNNYKTLKKYIQLYDIDISHFVKNYDRVVKLNIKSKIPLENILVENSNYSRTNLKKRLYKEGLKERKCELCGQGEEWNKMKISLILDHKNGVHDDNRIENLRIVCPNCNAGLDTHCGKNIKKVKINKKYYCKCGEEINKYSKMCILCNSKDKRKVKIPTYGQLLDDVKNLNYTNTGKKYGVSDNSIRKWMKKYEEEIVN